MSLKYSEIAPSKGSLFGRGFLKGTENVLKNIYNTGSERRKTIYENFLKQESLNEQRKYDEEKQKKQNIFELNKLGIENERKNKLETSKFLFDITKGYDMKNPDEAGKAMDLLTEKIKTLPFSEQISEMTKFKNIYLIKESTWQEQYNLHIQQRNAQKKPALSVEEFIKETKGINVREKGIDIKEKEFGLKTKESEAKINQINSRIDFLKEKTKDYNEKQTFSRLKDLIAISYNIYTNSQSSKKEKESALNDYNIYITQLKNMDSEVKQIQGVTPSGIKFKLK